MKIDNFRGSNWLTHHYIDIDFAPLTLIGGDNSVGKSSVLDGISFAMMSELRRVSLKSDRPELITEGQEKGEVALTCDGVRVVRSVNTGKLIETNALPLGDGATREAVPFCLDATLFARSTPEVRRDLLMRLPGLNVQLTPQRLKDELIKRGHTKELVKLLPDDSMATWEKFATTKTSEARGEWKGITGETYGAQKAKGWAAPMAQQIDQATIDEKRAETERLTADLQALNRRVGAATAAAEARTKVAEERSRLQPLVDNIDLVRATLAQANVNLDDARNRRDAARNHSQAVAARGQFTAAVCPHCVGKVWVGPDGALTARKDDPPKTDANAGAVLKNLDAEVRQIEAARDQAHRDLAAAEHAATRLDELQTPSTDDGIDPSAIDAQIGDKREALKQANAALQALETTRQEWELSRDATAKAQAAHTAVEAWTKITTAVSPNGVAAELLAAGMEPLTKTLRAWADATGWPQVTVDANMRIRGGNRLYDLMSESERWRTDAMITVTIAILSKVRFVLLDRLDVLSVQTHRGCAMGWLYELAQGGTLDTVIVCATLKEPPPAPPGMAVHWIGQGKDK